ncbi:hypothetical protein Taro_055507 [Colocasia esculenta]|uniref:3'-5' exonuclease domain-containing protein n=1 Tax=Colocasia esculenta TaxID=4460 RepID=A0A843XUF1_COLES|nr:hypothetical protein [Colocasia esculenta]
MINFGDSLRDVRTSTWTVMMFGRRITAKVSRDADDINSWVNGVYGFHGRRICEGRLVAGLGVQWRPGSGPAGREPTAVVQICVGRRCLIVQLGRCSKVPSALKSFLEDGRVTFTGVGISDDVRRLGFRELQVGNPREVRKMAVAKYGPQWSNASMGNLADQVLGINGVTKGRRVGCSNWDAEVLSSAQVQYACEDAYLAFRLGLSLV